MQLSLLTDLPELEKKIFLDIYAQVYFDSSKKRIRLKTIDGQHIPAEMRVGCPSSMLKDPEGTIYKLDARLIQRNGRQPYFLAINRRNLQKALEFFDHNLSVQRGTKPERAKKKVLFERNKPLKG
jgi:hypothetical protein